MRKILCLDIDGVLWNTAWSHYLHSTETGREQFKNLTEKKNLITPLSPENVSALNILCESVPELEIAIVSSWIKLDSNDEKSKFYKFIERHLKLAGFKYFDRVQTEWDSEKDKQQKLENILKDSNMSLTKDSVIVVIDDHHVRIPSEYYCTVHVHQINNLTGFTINDAEHLCRYFGNDLILPAVLF